MDTGVPNWRGSNKHIRLSYFKEKINEIFLVWSVNPSYETKFQKLRLHLWVLIYYMEPAVLIISKIYFVNRYGTGLITFMKTYVFLHFKFSWICLTPGKYKESRLIILKSFQFITSKSHRENQNSNTRVSDENMVTDLQHRFYLHFCGVFRVNESMNMCRQAKG